MMIAVGVDFHRGYVNMFFITANNDHRKIYPDRGNISLDVAKGNSAAVSKRIFRLTLDLINQHYIN